MPYTNLTREERHTIEKLYAQGNAMTAIALTLGRNKSTISRELKRNRNQQGDYEHQHADTQARERAQTPRYHYKQETWAVVESKLRLDWSPEQITNALKKEGQDVPSHERIYTYIWEDKRKGGTLHTHLRHKIGSYKKRGSGREKRGRIKNQVMIDERPAEVDLRERIGDWELDTIIGRVGGAVLVTIVDRMSRYTIIKKAESKEADAVGEQLFYGLLPHAKHNKVLTLTADNGKEFAGHRLTSRIFDCGYYFAHPYHSWERGLNENTNGLIRQYFPKKTSFDHLTDEDIQLVQDKLNSRPRKCLDFQSPNDIFFRPPYVALAS